MRGRLWNNSQTSARVGGERHKNWRRFLVATGNLPTQPFMAKELVAARLKGILEIEERFLQSRE